MSEILNDPRVYLGAIFGFVLFCTISIAKRQITAASVYSEKWKAGHRDTLLRKFKEAGYAAYSPIVMGSQINLKDPLTHEELVVLSLDGMVVFDEQGNTITALVPLTTQSEQLAEDRRAQFRVIRGGKED